MRLLLLLVLAAIAALPHAARAEVPSAWERAPHNAELQLGIASPIGLGLAVDSAPLRWLSLWVGAGLNSEGVQLAGGVRLRAVRTPGRAWYAGVAPSVGRYREPTPDEEAHRLNRRAVWANAEGGLELRRARGLTFRAFVGVTHMLNQGEVVCVGDDISGCRPDELWGATLPYGGVAIGHSF